MFSSIIKADEENFPKSFILLQQEAILANTSLLSGFEYLIRGHTEDVYKGAYYAAFFDLSIGIERLLKLSILTHSFIENDCSIPKPINFKKTYGHKILDLYSTVQKIDKYPTKIPVLEKLNHKILSFFQEFAEAKLGRYYNIEGLFNSEMTDPIQNWEKIMDDVKCNDITERTFHALECKVFRNINPALQLDDLAHNTGYVNGVYKYHLYQRVNRCMLWRIIGLLRPIIRMLNDMSMECHKIETEKLLQNMPSIPYFDEFFLFAYSSKEAVFRRKIWTTLAIPK
jgi:hypothetical protein